MTYVRFFRKRSWLPKWFDAQPELPDLLECFEVHPHAKTPKRPPSVYAVRTPDEELRTVAAMFETAPSRADKSFVIRIAVTDCEAAGITIDDSSKGTTGVRSVDSRHADLRGSVEQFKSLVAQLLAKIWEGEDRVRAFPCPSILVELAVLAQMDEELDQEARERCNEVLRRSLGSYSFAVQDGRRVEISRDLKKADSLRITASRLIPREGTSRRGLWQRILAKLRTPRCLS